jgi:hypothetical protein
MPMEVNCPVKENPSSLPAIINQLQSSLIELISGKHNDYIRFMNEQTARCMESIVTQLSIRPIQDTPTMAMNAKELVDELFELDKEIRWVGIVDQRGDILENAQRPGTVSYVDPKTEERTLKEFPTIMGLFWRELVGGSGELCSVVVAYSRVYLLAFYVDDFLVVVSFNPGGISSVINNLAARYGTFLPKGDLDSKTV